MSKSFFFASPEKPLDAAQTQKLFDEIFEGGLSHEELTLYLAASADRRPTVEELIGAARSMRAHMRPVRAPEGAMDLCGTGGDGLGTLNISTAVSFVVAAAGVIVAKHGNRSMSSRSGAADVLEALGVKIDLEPDAAERVLAQTGLVFLFAQTFHPAKRHAAQARRDIGRRTIFNLLGPLANPASVTRQLVGVFGKEWLMPYAEALRATGTNRAMVVHGRDGLDELTITGPSDIVMLDGAALSAAEITPADASLPTGPLAALKGGDGVHNAARLEALFSGEQGPYRDIVLLNSAAALIVAGRAKDIKEGAGLAAEMLDSGAAKAKLSQLVTASRQ